MNPPQLTLEPEETPAVLGAVLHVAVGIVVEVPDDRVERRPVVL